MQSIEELLFLKTYSVPTLIISLAISLITLIVQKFLYEKLPLTLIDYLPFLLGIIFNGIYLLIVRNVCYELLAEIISAGIICGSLSTVFTAFVKRILSGKKEPFSAVSLSIEETLGKYVIDEKRGICLIQVKSLIINGFSSNKEEKEISQEVALLLKNNTKEKTESELLSIASLTVKSALTLLKK